MSANYLHSMRKNQVALICVLYCILGLLAPAANAIDNCPLNTAAAPALNTPRTDAAQVGRLLAGMGDPNGQPGMLQSEYVAQANEGWQSYLRTFGNPLYTWASAEVRIKAGATVFYPFSGPDLPSVMAIFPAASHFVLISDQYANPYFDPFALEDPNKTLFVHGLGEAWSRFGRLGFFLTQDLNKAIGSSHKYHLNPSMILMAFATRLGYEVRSVQPICLDGTGPAVRVSDDKSVRWSSVRLELSKGGRSITVDYIQQDLSNRGLRRHPEVLSLIESLSRGPVLLKAASHLPQKPAFSMLARAIADNTPILVQDETGLEYDEMAKHFDVQLYGQYAGPQRLFKEATNPSLVLAYKQRANEIRPLNFQLGYEKETGSAIQIGIRR